MLKLGSLKIDPEFSAQILPLSFEELQQLEMNMIRDGKLTDPIIVWNKTILDGHNRYNILRKHSFIEYEIKEMEFSSRQEALIWICNHQLGRRNLTPERRKYLIGKRYEIEKQVSQTAAISIHPPRKMPRIKMIPAKTNPAATLRGSGLQTKPAPARVMCSGPKST